MAQRLTTSYLEHLACLLWETSFELDLAENLPEKSCSGLLSLTATNKCKTELTSHSHQTSMSASGLNVHWPCRVLPPCESRRVCTACSIKGQKKGTDWRTPDHYITLATRCGKRNNDSYNSSFQTFWTQDPHFHHKTKEKKWYLYSAIYTEHSLKALRHGSHSFTCKLHHACLTFVSVHQMAPPLTMVADIQLQPTTLLSIPKGWKAELAWLVDLQRTVYLHTWLPVSYGSIAGQGKFDGQRPTFYRCATQPAVMHETDSNGQWSQHLSYSVPSMVTTETADC